jgi:tetratricopeptide (TPR) repeat protein
MKLLNERKYEQASRALDGASGRSADLGENSQAALALARAMVKEGKLGEAGALEDYREVSAKFKSTPAGKLARSRIEKLWSVAPKEHSHAGHSEHESQSALGVKAKIREHAAKGEILKVRPLVEAYVKSNPTSSEAVELALNYAEQLEALDHKTECHALLKHLVEKVPLAANDPAVLIEYAHMENLAQRPESALDAVEKALQHAPKPRLQARALLAKAVSLRDMHKIEEAKATLEKARKLAQESGERDVVNIAKILTKPGHSLGPDAHNTPSAESSQNSFGSKIALMGTAFVGFVSVAGFVLRQRKR